MALACQIMEDSPSKPAKIDLSPADHPDGDLPDIVDLGLEMGAPPPTPWAPANLEALVETATGYARAASSENTQTAYAKDWRHFSAWCRRNGFEPLPPEVQTIGLYISACASGSAAGEAHRACYPFRSPQLNAACRPRLELYQARFCARSIRSACSHGACRHSQKTRKATAAERSRARRRDDKSDGAGWIEIFRTRACW